MFYHVVQGVMENTFELNSLNHDFSDECEFSPYLMVRSISTERIKSFCGFSFHWGSLLRDLRKKCVAHLTPIVHVRWRTDAISRVTLHLLNWSFDWMARNGRIC